MKPSVRKSLLAGAALLVLGAGTAVAVLSRSGREVTTTSAEAYRWYRKGLEEDGRLYHRDALVSYAKALELDPDFTMATLRLAGSLAGRDRDRARSLVQCAARSAGRLNDRERLYLSIVEAELLENDREKAGALVREYVRRFPDDPEGYFRLAVVHQREGKTEEMLATYDRLLALDPNQASAYNSLGYHYIGRRDFVKGEDYLKRYRFLAPDQANPFDSLGELYANTGRYDEAEEHLKRALEVKPDFVPSIGHLGTLEVGRGNPEAAARWFRRAGELSESWKERHGYVGAACMALVDAGRPDDALALLDDASTPPPGLAPKEEFAFRWNLVRSHAVVLALAGRAAEAEAELARLPGYPGDLGAKERDGYEKALRGPRAAIAGARGDTAGAVAGLRQVLAEEKMGGGGGFPYYPSAFRLRARLADALVTLGKADEARRELEPVLAVNPRFAPALSVIARIEGSSLPAPGSAGR